MYKLIIEDDEGKTTVVPLIRDEISIGRKEGNTIRLTERNVSRRHARLLRQNGTVYIEDLSSYNGIKVNGDRIGGRVVVGEGDRIQIGDYQLSIKIDRDVKSIPPAQPAKAPASAPGTQPAAPAPAERPDDEARTREFRKASETTEQIPAGAPLASQQTMQIGAVSQVQPAKDKPARLVVVSKNFFRQEFPLDKAAVVIGRTDENDVVVNHRSISRHHAKIVRDAGHYHIIDLQSANGVRVNGEEYGKVELRKGDQIDLGHVRLIFIPPGQEVEVTRPVDTEEPSGSKLWMAVVALLVVVGVVAAARYYMGSHPGPAGKTPGADGDAATVLADVDSDLIGRRWDDALAKSERVLKMTDISAKYRDVATAKRDKARQEKEAQGVYERFTTAAGGKKYDDALAIYGTLPPDSEYRRLAKDTYDQIFPLFATQHLDAAESARQAGNCALFQSEVEQVLRIESSHIAALTEKAKECGGKATAPVVQNEPKRPGRNPGGAKHPERPVKGPEENPDEGKGRPNVDPNALLTDAQQAYLNGDFSKAIELARPASHVVASTTRAWRIIGAAACNLRDLPLANEAYRHLDSNARQFIVYVCQRSGVSFERGAFKQPE